jgi:putative transposase
MPSRNILKEDAPNSYYHIYARGIGKQTIFPDPSDFEYFLNLLPRHLSKEQVQGKLGYTYPHYADDIELLAFCLMPNHFHLLVYQKGVGGMTKLMKSIMTSYSRYFNLKYDRTGPLFESRYKAARISQDSYLQHISRYIHLNPRYWQRYKYSSVRFYLDEKSPEWLKPNKILDLFKERNEYRKFIEDYEDQKRMLEAIKHELANY